MKKIRQPSDISQISEEMFEPRVQEAAEYLEHSLCPVDQSRRFTAKAKRLVAELTGDTENALTRISNLVRIMLNKLGELHPEYLYTKQETETICNAAIFHDIGKLLLPQEVLQKPEKLLPEELTLVQRHTEFGYEIVSRVKQFSASPYGRFFEEVCRYHHERWDGEGYPYGLVGAQIPMYVQVVAIVDVYDALISKRGYKPTYSHTAAMEMIESGECGFFNPVILECFRQVSELTRLEAEHYQTTPKFKQAWLYKALKRLNFIVFIGMLVVVALIVSSVSFFADNLFSNVMEDKIQELKSFTQNASTMWVQNMQSDISTLNTSILNSEADIEKLKPGNQLDSYHTEISAAYQDIAKLNSFTVFGLVTAEKAVTNGAEMIAEETDSVYSVFDYDALKSKIAALTIFNEWRNAALVDTCRISSELNGEIVWSDGYYLAVPVFDKSFTHKDVNSVVGFMLCAYRSSDLVNDYNFNISNDKGEAHVFLHSGAYVYNPTGRAYDTFYDFLQSLDLLKTSFDTVKDEIISYKDNVVHYKENGEKRYGYYMHINQTLDNSSDLNFALNEWCAFVSFKEEDVMHYVTQIQRAMVLLFSLIGVVLLAMIALIMLKLKQVLNMTKEMALQYDEIRQNLEVSENKYKMVLAQTKHLVFEFDHSTYIVTHTESNAARYGFPMAYKYDPENPTIRPRIHPDDYEAYKKMYHDVLGGKEYAEANLRLLRVDGVYVWNRCIMRNIYDEEKRAIKSIGFAEDVNTILTETQNLRDTAMKDSFTDVLNKTSIEDAINKELSTQLPGLEDGEEKHAFLIMDLDKFKVINDTFGHATGDLILKNFASLLKRNARGYDLVGRVGGDEFVFFMQGIHDDSAAINKAKTLIELARSIGGSRVACSISMGIAFAPTDGNTYQELYEKADKAMYIAKANGGNNWSAF